MQKTINGKSFAEILEEIMNHENKKSNEKTGMDDLIDESMLEMKQEIAEHGEVATGFFEVDKCQCGCGSVKITAEFTAFAFSEDGIEVTEGTIERIITIKIV